MNGRKLNQLLGGNEMPRFGAPATFMRLPAQATAKGLDACFVGVPMDIGTSNRPGTRFGPRQIRAESSFVRPYNMASRAAPFDSLQVADIGDVAIDTFNLPKCMDIITDAYDRILAHDCIPLTLGGDHTIALPLLGAAALALYGFAQGALLTLDVLVTATDAERSTGLLGQGRTGFFYRLGGAALLACAVILVAQSGLVRLAAG